MGKYIWANVANIYYIWANMGGSRWLDFNQMCEEVQNVIDLNVLLGCNNICMKTTDVLSLGFFQSL